MRFSKQDLKQHYHSFKFIFYDVLQPVYCFFRHYVTLSNSCFSMHSTSQQNIAQSTNYIWFPSVVGAFSTCSVTTVVTGALDCQKEDVFRFRGQKKEEDWSRAIEAGSTGLSEFVMEVKRWKWTLREEIKKEKNDSRDKSKSQTSFLLLPRALLKKTRRQMQNYEDYCIISSGIQS